MKKTLEEIYLDHGIAIRDEHGFLRNPIDILEDLYIRLSPDEFKEINDEIMFQEKNFFIFQEERKKGNI
jgi:hypothetical protein